MAKDYLDSNIGPSKGERVCAHCKEVFEHGSINRMLCSNRCKKASYYCRHKSLIDEKQKVKNHTEAGRVNRRRYKVSDLGRATKRAYSRNRAASSAISAILLPVQKHPEV
jgi:hypothetical protein